MAPDEEAWETHEEEIRRLYYQTTRVRLMAHMEKEYGFVASKAQYERRFADWGLRKKIKAQEGEWDYILVKKRKRDDLGKSSIVRLNGHEISTATIKKRQNRYTLGELQSLQDTFSTLNPPTPKGISVTTPPGRESSPTLSPAPFRQALSQSLDISIGGKYPSIHEVETVPEDDFKKHVVCRQIPTHNLPYFCYVNLVRSIDSSGALCALLGSSPAGLEEAVPKSRQLQFEDDDLNFPGSVWDLEQSIPPISFISPPPDKMIWQLFTSQLQVYQIPSTKLELQRSLFARLRPLILEQELGGLNHQLERLFGPSDKDCFLEFLNLVVYFVSNDLLLLHERTSILEWLLRQGKGALRRMMSIPLPTVRSFLVAMVDTAIELSDYEAGRDLLDADIHQGLYFNHVEQLLHAAVSLDHTQMARKLVRTHQKECLELQNSLLSASTVEMTKILLGAGANVNGPEGEGLSPLEAALWSGNSELVHLLVQHKADVNRTTFGCSIMFRAIGTGNPEILQCLLDAGALCINVPQDQGNLPVNKRTYGRTPKTELQLAASIGRPDLMAVILSNEKATVGLRQGNFRWAPLRDAAESGNSEVVKLLVSAGVDINAKSSLEDVFTTLYDRQAKSMEIRALPQTALLAAIEENSLEVVRILIESGAEVNTIAFSAYGSCALEVAYNLGNLEIVEYLKNQGAIERLPSAKNDGVLALRLAVRRGDLTRARLLINEGVHPVCILDHIPRYLAKKERETAKEALSFFLQVCEGTVEVRTSWSKESPLEIALRLRDFDVARSLMSVGCMVNPEDVHVSNLFQTMYWWDSNDLAKIEREQLMVVDMLKDMWAMTRNPIYLSHALQIASRLGNLHSVKHLVSLGAVVKTRFQSTSLNPLGEDLVVYKPPLQLALQAMRWKGTKDYSVVEFLLDQGADPNEHPRSGGKTLKISSTALQFATWLNSKTVKLLLDRGADINAPASGHMGKTALQAAVSINQPSIKIIDLLLQSGADVNAQPSSQYGVTALQGAAIEGHTRIALMFLERGADPNAPGAPIHGRTALEGAAERGRLDMVQLLLNANAEPQESAIQFAEEKGYFVIADIIREKMRV